MDHDAAHIMELPMELRLTGHQGLERLADHIHRDALNNVV